MYQIGGVLTSRRDSRTAANRRPTRQENTVLIELLRGREALAVDAEACDSPVPVTASRNSRGEVGAFLPARSSGRTKMAWVLACVVPGLLVQALESRGAPPSYSPPVSMGRCYSLEIGVSVKCHDSSCSSSGRTISVPPQDVAGVVVKLTLVPEMGGPDQELGFSIGSHFVPPISGHIRLDDEAQSDARNEIERRAESKCDRLEVVAITLDDQKTVECPNG